MRRYDETAKQIGAEVAAERSTHDPQEVRDEAVLSYCAVSSKSPNSLK